jgi:DNA-binding Lrp family transcriptional regulator
MTGCGPGEFKVHRGPAQRLFGEPDYLLHVVTQDLPAFQRLYDDSLSTLPNVQRLTSTLVMKRVIQDRPLPL